MTTYVQKLLRLQPCLDSVPLDAAFAAQDLLAVPDSTRRADIAAFSRLAVIYDGARVGTIWHWTVDSNVFVGDCVLRDPAPASIRRCLPLLTAFRFGYSYVSDDAAATSSPGSNTMLWDAAGFWTYGAETIHELTDCVLVFNQAVPDSGGGTGGGGSGGGDSGGTGGTGGGGGGGTGGGDSGGGGGGGGTTFDPELHRGEAGWCGSTGVWTPDPKPTIIADEDYVWTSTDSGLCGYWTKVTPTQPSSPPSTGGPYSPGSTWVLRPDGNRWEYVDPNPVPAFIPDGLWSAEAQWVFVPETSSWTWNEPNPHPDTPPGTWSGNAHWVRENPPTGEVWTWVEPNPHPDTSAPNNETPGWRWNTPTFDNWNWIPTPPPPAGMWSSYAAYTWNTMTGDWDWNEPHPHPDDISYTMDSAWVYGSPIQGQWNWVG